MTVVVTLLLEVAVQTRHNQILDPEVFLEILL